MLADTGQREGVGHVLVGTLSMAGRSVCPKAIAQMFIIQLPRGLLAPCGRVFLEESIQYCLHEKLADAFKGSGGSARRSTVKIDVL